MEYKVTPTFVKVVSDRTVVGIFSVFGNVDDYGDIIHPGSFVKTIAERNGKIRHLWQHDFWSPPIAVIKEVREVPLAELPEQVLRAAPDATGGVEVTREYLPTERGDEVLAALKAGALDEMSFGFDPLKFDFETIGEERIRNIREVRLWETSDVLWGANDATAALKSALPLTRLLAALQSHLTSVKAGARHSSTDLALLNHIHAAVVDLGATSCAGLLDPEADSKAVTPPPEPDPAPAESRAASLDQDALTLLHAGIELFDLEQWLTKARR